MKFPFKVACLLLSLMLLLNAAGFAAMLGCDQECCQSSPRSVSTHSSSTSCHEGEEMGQASDAALQVETRPLKAPPLNSFQCDREVASALFLTEKADCRYDLVASASLEQVLADPKDHGRESACCPSSPPLSLPIIAPLRN